MDLHYLDFDSSDEDSGAGTFDAMAAVRPERLPALMKEIAAVLHWAYDAFGAPGSPPEQGDWDYDLQAVAETDKVRELALSIAYDEARRTVEVADAGDVLTTVTLTLTGTPAFCDAFQGQFALAD